MASNSPRRICHVTYSFYECDNRVMRYAELLATRGDHVDVIALRQPGGPRRFTLNNVNVYAAQRRSRDEKSPWAYLLKILSFFFRSMVILLARANRRGYDIVHVHNIPDFLVFAALGPKIRGSKIILDIHDVVPELFAGKFGVDKNSIVLKALLRVEKNSCRFADFVIIANDIWHERLLFRSVASAKCASLLNYPDTSLFHAARRESKQADDNFVFLYPGTLNHHQGLDIAIAAFASVEGQMPSAELRICGEGPALPALREQATALGVASRVQFIARVPVAEVPRLMNDADVGIVPKRADGFGNEAFSTKVLEFMACSIPVIAARTKVDSYYFGDDTVSFFTPGDPNDLARCMLAVYKCRNMLRPKVQAAEQLARRMSWQENSHLYLEIIDRLVAVRKADTGLSTANHGHRAQ